MKQLLLKYFLACILSIFCFDPVLKAQDPDFFDQLIQKKEYAFTMEDGTSLATDVYLPVPKQAIKVPVDLPIGNLDSVTLFQQGEQYLVYDSFKGGSNPAPRELPFILERTPYNKLSESNLGLLAFLGYGIAIQDTRGRYASEGVFYPFISNGWPTEPYHPGFNHLLDSRQPQASHSSNTFSDGAQSIHYLLDSLKREIDTNDNGQTDKKIDLTNGSLGMFGASASGYNQLRAVASMKSAPADSPGLKGIMPIVATGEFHQSTGFHNFVYRKGLVESWIPETYKENLSADPSLVAKDSSIGDTHHTVADYPFNTVDKITSGAIHHVLSKRYNNGLPGFYPNSPIRQELDISRATINAQGKGVANGSRSRYNNMDVPAYHLTGWWDIFINGQLETFFRTNQHTDLANHTLVIGPWTHQTIGERDVGDFSFPQNVNNLFQEADLKDLDLSSLGNSELFQWFRQRLNYNQYKPVGEPKFVLRASQKWQSIGNNSEIRFPGKDYYVDFPDMLAFLAGNQSLNNVPVAVKGPLGNVSNQEITVPAPDDPLIQGIQGLSDQDSLNKDFEKTPRVRFYVAGSPGNSQGNYWYRADSFPPKTANIQAQKLFWQGGQSLGPDSSLSGTKTDSFLHDPLNPVYTIGGNNMNVRTPDDQDKSQGPKNLKAYEDTTLNEEKVLQWQTNAIRDSLCIMGQPAMKLQFRTAYADAAINQAITNTHFFVRVLDVHPDGREIFITEGAVNAYARNYTEQTVENPELARELPFLIDTASFSNIETGKRYELQFNLLPIAYTLGDGHKLKIVISSSNYPKYQVSPGLPMVDSTFFRWNPEAGKVKGHPSGETSPRKLKQTILTAEENSTFIQLPIYGRSMQGDTTQSVSGTAEPNSNSEVAVYPNPASDYVNIQNRGKPIVRAQVMNHKGKILINKAKQGSFQLDIANLRQGLYFIRLITKNGEAITKKVVKNPH